MVEHLVGELALKLGGVRRIGGERESHNYELWTAIYSMERMRVSSL